MSRFSLLGRPIGWSLAFALLTVVAVITWVSTPLDASPDYEITYLYYFDAGLTQLAGAKYIQCDGVHTVGTQTQYFQVEIGETCSNWACTDVPVDPYDPTQGFEEVCGWRN